MKQVSSPRGFSRRAKMFILSATIVLAVATVWLRLEVVKTSYEIGQVDQEIQSLKLEKEKLSLRTVELKSPRKLETVAKQRFKLAPPTTDQIIYMNAAPKRGSSP